MIRQPGEKFQNFRERIKKEARLIKEHLKGKIIKHAGGRKIRGRRKAYRSNLFSMKPSYQSQSRSKRKIRNKMAYKSKRINRLRRA